MREHEQSVFVTQKVKMPLMIRILNSLRKMTLKRHVLLFSKRLKEAKDLPLDLSKVGDLSVNGWRIDMVPIVMNLV